MEIKIDIMNCDDLKKIKDILISDFDDFWNYNILSQELLSKNSKYFVAKEANNNIVGFAGVQFIIDEADITNIVVKKNYRNKGIGSILLEKLISISKKNNMSCITLEVNENNINAIKLYNKYNFKTTGIRKKYYNGTDNALIMQLEF